MASKNKVAKLKNSYCLPGMLKNKASGLKLKRTAFYTSADRQELNNEVEKILEDEYDEEQQFDYKVEKNECYYIKDGDLPKEGQKVLILFTLPDKSKNDIMIAKFENNDFNLVDLDAVITWKEIVFPTWQEIKIK